MRRNFWSLKRKKLLRKLRRKERKSLISFLKALLRRKRRNLIGSTKDWLHLNLYLIKKKLIKWQIKREWKTINKLETLLLKEMRI